MLKKLSMHFRSVPRQRMMALLYARVVSILAGFLLTVSSLHACMQPISLVIHKSASNGGDNARNLF